MLFIDAPKFKKIADSRDKAPHCTSQARDRVWLCSNSRANPTTWHDDPAGCSTPGAQSISPRWAPHRHAASGDIPKSIDQTERINAARTKECIMKLSTEQTAKITSITNDLGDWLA
jgi:hypothetical protein